MRNHRYFLDLINGNYNSIVKNNSLVYIELFRFDLFLFVFLKQHQFSRYTNLIDMFGIDYLTHFSWINRISIYYNFLNLQYNQRIIIRINTNLYEAFESLTKLYIGANWLEREIWDLYGIFFLNHPDLRRILTDYGFKGFPLRKDFPLSGFNEIYYDDRTMSLISNKLELGQAYRLFEFKLPWIKQS